MSLVDKEVNPECEQVRCRSKNDFRNELLFPDECSGGKMCLDSNDHHRKSVNSSRSIGDDRKTFFAVGDAGDWSVGTCETAAKQRPFSSAATLHDLTQAYGRIQIH